MMQRQNWKLGLLATAIGMGLALAAPSGGVAAPLPGGTLDPLTIPKYVTPLVIPPVMATTDTADNYDIAVRQFKQQILPGGIWNTVTGRADAFPPTTVWGYGPKADVLPDSTALGGAAGVAPAPNSQFNYPAYTIETVAAGAYGPGNPVNIRWRNELVADPIACAASLTPATDPACNYLPHLLPVDRTLHWANPELLPCMDGVARTDCRPDGSQPNPLLLTPYQGPVPMVTHVHGAHVEGHSDGYPEAWWLPQANNIPAGYATEGSFFDDANDQRPGSNSGYVEFTYRNDQPATTIWYHDHTLGMTRLNVYAGPAGFWLIRGGTYDGATLAGNGSAAAVLPGPFPAPGQSVLQLNLPSEQVRQGIREIPIAIQDRSFNLDGSLFYPSSRTFFDGYKGPYTGSAPTSTDLAPLWNPEAFFNVMVVNGVSWPQLEVAPALYRLRLLNGNNSRFLNLALFEIIPNPNKGKKQGTGEKLGRELPFYQIGAEQGFLPQVVQIQTGFATPITPGTQPTAATLIPASNTQQALLMGLAERADVLVDFRGLPTGTRIRMLNTAPDAPFAGFPDVPADPSTTGQVMEFVVNGALNGASITDPAGATPATDPWNLVPNKEPASTAGLAATRQVSLNEEASGQVCVAVTPSGRIRLLAVIQPPPLDPTQMIPICAALGGVPMAPKAALVGTVDLTNPAMPTGVPLMWTDMSGTSTETMVSLQNGEPRMVPVTENPTVGDTEEWQIYNFTVDAHPIHLHLVRFEVTDRAAIPGAVPAAVPAGVQPWERGYKDTVIAYPGEITTVKALFDIAGLYVWHCHIVEHEDNEMMRPYIVSP